MGFRGIVCSVPRLPVRPKGSSPPNDTRFASLSIVSRGADEAAYKSVGILGDLSSSAVVLSLPLASLSRFPAVGESDFASVLVQAAFCSGAGMSHVKSLFFVAWRWQSIECEPRDHKEARKSTFSRFGRIHRRLQWDKVLLGIGHNIRERKGPSFGLYSLFSCFVWRCGWFFPQHWVTLVPVLALRASFRHTCWNVSKRVQARRVETNRRVFGWQQSSMYANSHRTIAIPFSWYTAAAPPGLEIPPLLLLLLLKVPNENAFPVCTKIKLQH